MVFGFKKAINKVGHSIHKEISDTIARQREIRNKNQAFQNKVNSIRQHAFQQEALKLAKDKGKLLAQERFMPNTSSLTRQFPSLQNDIKLAQGKTVKNEILKIAKVEAREDIRKQLEYIKQRDGEKRLRHIKAQKELDKLLYGGLA